jgi:spore coat protein U-like protein
MSAPSDGSRDVTWERADTMPDHLSCHAWMRLSLLTAVAVCVLCLPLRPAHAQSCTYAIDDVNFGNITPIENQPVLAQTTFTATCTGNANQTVRVCLGIGGGSGSPVGTSSPRLMLSGSDQLQFEIYSDANRAVRWGSMSFPGSGTPPALFIPLPATAGNPAIGTQTLYLKIFTGQQSAPLGTYVSDFATNHIGIEQTYATTGSCTTEGFGQADFRVQATVQNECDVTADPLNFGSHGVLSANVDATADLQVTCTLGTNYTISLGNGQNGISELTRKMANGASMIAYGLYSDPGRNTVFGSQLGSTLGGTGTGFADTVTVYGRVPPQVTPEAGAYSDTVVVNVTY